MFHSSTELLIDYWRSRRRERRLPARADIDPGGFPALAPRAFVAVREGSGDVRWRLAGEQVIGLHGRPLAGESLLRLWRPESRWRLSSLLRTALAAAKPLVILAETFGAEDGSARLEILFAPLSGPDGEADRFLGLYQPAGGANQGPLAELALLEIREAPGVLQRSHLRLAAIDGRRIA